jgi:hypothetical protein
MSYMTKDSAFKLTPAQEAKVAEMTSMETISDYLKEIAVADGTARQSRDNPNFLIATPQNSQPQTFARDVAIGNQVFHFEANSELRLSELINQALLVAQAAGTQSQRTEPVRQQQPQKRYEPAMDESVRRIDLENQLRRGEISANEYLEAGGFAHLYNTTPKALKATQEAEYESAWKQATDLFLESRASEGWEPNEENAAILNEQLVAMGLENNPSVESIAAAWNRMRQLNLVVANPQPAPTPKPEPKVVDPYSYLNSVEEVRAFAKATNGQDVNSAPSPIVWKR